MAELTIKTNNQWRKFLYRDEVPPKVLEKEFDWTTEEDHHDGYFKYRGQWYHESEFMVPSPGNLLKEAGWMGVNDDSFFSGVAIRQRIGDDGECEFQVCTYMV